MSALVDTASYMKPAFVMTTNSFQRNWFTGYCPLLGDHDLNTLFFGFSVGAFSILPLSANLHVICKLYQRNFYNYFQISDKKVKYLTTDSDLASCLFIYHAFCWHCIVVLKTTKITCLTKAYWSPLISQTVTLPTLSQVCEQVCFPMKAGSLVFYTTFVSFLADPCASLPLLSSGYCQSNWRRITCPVCMLAQTFQNVILGKKPLLTPPCFYLWLCIPGTEGLFLRSVGAICSSYYSKAWKPDSYGQFSVITLIWHLFLPQFTDIMVTIHSWNKYLKFAGLR